MERNGWKYNNVPCIHHLHAPQPHIDHMWTGPVNSWHRKHHYLFLGEQRKQPTYKMALTSAFVELTKGFKSSSNSNFTGFVIFSVQRPLFSNLFRCSETTSGAWSNVSCFSTVTWWLQPPQVNLVSSSSIFSTLKKDSRASVTLSALLISKLRSSKGSNVSEWWLHSEHFSWK